MLRMRDDMMKLQSLIYRSTASPATSYKKFFKGAILVALSVGCLFGAFMLLYYGVKKSFFAVPLNLIHLHGHAQIFGWIGLMAMGFGYSFYPRFKQVRLVYPRGAELSFYLMVSGLIIRSLAQAFLKSQALISLGVLAGILEFIAVTLFVMIMLKTFKQSQQGVEVYDKFIFTALVSFWLVAVFNPVLFYLVNTAADTQRLISYIATWFQPYRDLQMLAFASMLIFGMSLRFIPAHFKLKPVSQSNANVIFVLFTVAIIADIVFYLLMRTMFSPIWGIGLQVAFLAMLIATILLIRQLKIFQYQPGTDRSLKFIRAAFIWLIAAWVLLILAPVYNRLTGQAFSHAFFGAYRHALTVGFISMMILGISSKAIPILAGADATKLNPLNQVFYLLNIGNIMRVGLQIATDHFEWAYAMMSVSGFIEVAAFALWGADLWRTMDYQLQHAVTTVLADDLRYDFHSIT